MRKNPSIALPGKALQAESAEVFYREGDIRLLGPADFELLKQLAAETPRRRARICLHGGPDASIHEMLIIHPRDAYVRPHAHRHHDESLMVMEGEAMALFFDADGQVIERLELAAPGPDARGRAFYYRIPKQQYHALIIQSEWLIFQEVAAGPFDRSATMFPDWAPAGEDAAAGLAWLSHCLA